LPAMVGGASALELQLLERLAVFWSLSYQLLDDIKDVCKKPEQSGKTAQRDATVNRPNVAQAIGVKKALLRIERLLRLADRVLARLTLRQPSLSFLDEVHRRFRDEIIAIRSVQPARSQ
jgi:geranylgeranyl pyrophosphate synthase